MLLRADGVSQAATARALGVSRPVSSSGSVASGKRGWRALRTPRGRKASVGAEVRERIIRGATQPPEGRTRWSVRSMARATGVSKDTVQRLWRANDIKPHVTRTFKLSTDPHFEEKFWDVIGLYLDPPERSLVLCCDEKSQCQALERSQPGFPVVRGHSRTQTHDYRRHGTVTLFAALSYLDGKAYEARTQWLAFLPINRETPECTDRRQLGQGPGTTGATARRTLRIALHFTPTSSSWLNLVERFAHRRRRSATAASPACRAIVRLPCRTQRSTPNGGPPSPAKRILAKHPARPQALQPTVNSFNL